LDWPNIDVVVNRAKFRNMFLILLYGYLAHALDQLISELDSSRCEDDSFS
jgi:hypothetical protein